MKSDQKFELLKLELDHLQRTFDRYDDLTFRGRNFFITIWIGCIGIAFTIKSANLLILTSLLALFYWFFEGMIRFQYWHRHVNRYRYLRDTLNSEDFEFNKIEKIYDLSDHFKIGKKHYEDTYEESKRKSRRYASFIRREPIIVYGLMGFIPLILWGLIYFCIISFPTN